MNEDLAPAGDDLTFMWCTCGHNQTFHWAHRGACEACACLFFKLRKAVTR